MALSPSPSQKCTLCMSSNLVIKVHLKLFKYLWCKVGGKQQQGTKGAVLGGSGLVWVSIKVQLGYEPKMVAHIYFMFRIYLELHLNLLLKQLKVLKRVRLSVGLCFRFQAYFVRLIRNVIVLGSVLVSKQCVVNQGKILGFKCLNWDLSCWFRS